MEQGVMSEQLQAAASSCRCAVCDSGSFRKVREEESGHSILRCELCGVWTVSPLPSLEELRNRYDDDYYAPWIGQAKRRRRMWDRRMKLLHGIPRGRLMDVGCADGAFMERARESGFQVLGSEFSPVAAARTSHWLNLPVYTGELQDLAIEPGSLRALTLWHVLEHTTRPGETLAAARRLLVDDGRLVVAVPNRRNPSFRALYRLVRRRSLRMYHPSDREQHLHHWDPASLVEALEHHGFQVLDLRPDLCALDPGKRLADSLGRIHTLLAGEPRTSAMVAVARPGRPVAVEEAGE